jgi:hypothetical protein
VTPDEPIPEEDILAGGGNHNDEDPARERITYSLATASQPEPTATHDVVSVGMASAEPPPTEGNGTVNLGI